MCGKGFSLRLIPPCLPSTNPHPSLIPPSSLPIQELESGSEADESSDEEVLLHLDQRHGGEGGSSLSLSSSSSGSPGEPQGRTSPEEEGEAGPKQDQNQHKDQHQDQDHGQYLGHLLSDGLGFWID